ncbi:hypothetical protein LEMLEM_LOCUS25729 [Lemmus lemmus]
MRGECAAARPGAVEPGAAPQVVAETGRRGPWARRDGTLESRPGNPTASLCQERRVSGFDAMGCPHTSPHGHPALSGALSSAALDASALLQAPPPKSCSITAIKRRVYYETWRPSPPVTRCAGATAGAEALGLNSPGSDCNTPPSRRPQLKDEPKDERAPEATQQGSLWGRGCPRPPLRRILFLTHQSFPSWDGPCGCTKGKEWFLHPPPPTKINSRKTPWKPWHALHLAPNRNRTAPPRTLTLSASVYPLPAAVTFPPSSWWVEEIPRDTLGVTRRRGSTRRGVPRGWGRGRVHATDLLQSAPVPASLWCPPGRVSAARGGGGSVPAAGGRGVRTDPPFVSGAFPGPPGAHGRAGSQLREQPWAACRSPSGLACPGAVLESLLLHSTRDHCPWEFRGCHKLTGACTHPGHASTRAPALQLLENEATPRPVATPAAAGAGRLRGRHGFPPGRGFPGRERQCRWRRLAWATLDPDSDDISPTFDSAQAGHMEKK